MNAVGFDGLFDLSGQFARRRQYQDARTTGLAQLERLGKQHMKNRQGKAGCFAGSCLCGGQQVPSRENARDGLCLDRGGCGVASIGNCTQKGIG